MNGTHFSLFFTVSFAIIQLIEVGARINMKLVHVRGKTTILSMLVALAWCLALASARTTPEGDDQQHCGHWGYSKACTDHGCSVCQLKWEVQVPLAHLCVKNTTASHLSWMYDCCSGGDPEPSPGPTPSPPHVVPSNACGYESRASCTANASCVWCYSSSAQSACYLWEDARRLPSSFQCSARAINSMDEVQPF